jgi:hypothetical protein
MCGLGRPVTPHDESKQDERPVRVRGMGGGIVSPPTPVLNRYSKSGIICNPDAKRSGHLKPLPSGTSRRRLKNKKAKRPPKTQFKAFAMIKRLVGSCREVDTTDPEFVAGVEAVGSLLDPGTIYPFKLTTHGTLTTSVGGVTSSSIVCDPSSYPEWSSLTALFSLCRLRKSTITLARAFNIAIPTATSSGSWYPTVFNALYDEVSAPVSYESVIDSPNWKLFNHNFFSGQSESISLKWDGDHCPLWGDVASPHSSTSFSGTPGCFQVYADNQTSSVTTLTYYIELEIEFMNRF